MVTFKNAGRLANYCFEFLAAWAYAKRNGFEFAPPTTTSDAYWSPLYFRHMDNPAFNSNLPIIKVKEQEHCYQELPIHDAVNNNVRLQGYFQSYKYWIEYIDEVREMFEFTKPTIWGTVSLHVRLGDYLLYPDKHPIVPMEYYREALSRIGTFKKVLVFSDDIEWCKKQDWQIPGIEFVFPDDELEDMKLMASCEHNITAASSYSVFAALMNANPNKIVVCPHTSNYFGKDYQHHDLKDLYPPDWVQIKY